MNQPSRKPKAPGTAVALLAALLLGGLAPSFAAKPDPGIASPTAEGSTKGVSKNGAKKISINSIPTSNTMSADAPAAKETLYSTDENTDLLERAIERFNRERCPPNTPIREIDGRSLSLLAEFRYIPADVSKFEKMVLRGGKVFKPIDKTQTGKQDPVDIPRGEVPDSLMSVLGVVADGLDEKSPKGSGNPAPSTQTLVEERRATFRNQKGELVEFKYFVPKIPPTRTRTFIGRVIRAPADMVKKDLLPTKYKLTPTTGTKAEPLPPQQ